MITNLNIEKNHVYIINTSLIEYIKEIGLHKKFEDYNLENQKLEILAICRDYEGGVLIEFFNGLVGYGDLKFTTGILCKDDEEVRAEIFRHLPHLLDYDDLKNLITTLEKDEV